ncbi:MAG: BolA family protein [Bdellovibrionota bacterium]
MDTRKNRLLNFFKNLNPVHLELVDESHKHSGHAKRMGITDGEPIETHFKLVMVSPMFQGKSRVERSQMVYGMLGEEFKNGLHALSQALHTPEEWQKLGKTLNFQTPNCAGESDSGKK